MKKVLVLLSILCLLFLFWRGACSPKNTESHSTLKKLYQKYQFGQIEECTWDGKKVYHAGLNAYDVGSQVYDEEGRSIGVCNYMARKVDSVCEKLSDCETVWRCEKHISGQPAVDKYGLSKTNKE